MESRTLANVLDDGSVDLYRLAMLLRANQDELYSADDDLGGDVANWKLRKSQIEIINNLVMNHLKNYSRKFGKLVDDYNADGHR